MFLEHVERIDGPGRCRKATRLLIHDVCCGQARPRGGVPLKGAPQIAIRDDAHRFAVAFFRFKDGSGTHPASGYGNNHLPDAVSRMDRDAGFRIDEIGQPQQQLAPEAATGMGAREILTAETAGFHQRHGEGIAHRELGSGTVGGRQVVRAGFLIHRNVEHQLGGPAHGAVGPAYHGHDREVSGGQHGQQAHDF